MVEVEIKDSPIHGKGVFSKQSVNPGELIGVYEGTIVWRCHDMDDDPYVLWLHDADERYFGIRGEGDLRHLNHEGDDPNAVLASNRRRDHDHLLG